MIDLMNQMAEVDKQTSTVTVSKHRFDADEDLDLDNLDL